MQANGLDLVVALDVSQSMLAEDVAPSRLQRARAELTRLVDALPGDRIGLVLFAGDAFIQCPLTTDHSAVRLFLDAAAPEMMPTQGTDFEAAVGAALDTFGPAPTAAPGARPAAARVLLIVSDGEKHTGNVLRLHSDLEAARVRTFAAGIGEAAGAPIPLYTNGQRVGEKLDPETGAAVITRLDPQALQALADGDDYLHIGAGAGLGALPDKLAGLARAPLDVTDPTSFRELYAFPLALALLLLLLEPLLTRGDLRRLRANRTPKPVEVGGGPCRPSYSAAARRRARKTRGEQGCPSSVRPRLMLRPLLLLALAASACAQADLDGRAGNRALARGEVPSALAHYDDGLGAADTSAHGLRFRLQNNAALAELARDSAHAALALADAATDAATGAADQSEGAYHAGIAAAATGAADEALARFRRAVLLAPANADAAYNWEVIARQQRQGGGGKGDPKDDQKQDNGKPESGDTPPAPAPPKPSPPDPSQAPPKMSEQEASQLLDALARDEAGLVRRTTRGTAQPGRPTKDW